MKPKSSVNIVITGGCGFIGGALVGRLIEAGGFKIRVIDNLSVGDRQSLSNISDFTEIALNAASSGWVSPLELIVADICDAQAMMTCIEGADHIVHLAANTGVAPSVENPRSDCITNVIGTLNCLEAARMHKIDKFVFASSGAPIGEQEPPQNEKMPARPASPYGASKLAGEGYCSAYFHCFGVNTVGLRFGNVYGPGSAQKESVVAKFIKRALKDEPIEIYGDGLQTRDFIYLHDLVDAIIASINANDIGGELFQIASAKEVTVSEITDQIMRAFEARDLSFPDIIHSEARIGDVKRNYSDTSKARDKLGWQATTPLSEGVIATLDYFLNLDNLAGLK